MSIPRTSSSEAPSIAPYVMAKSVLCRCYSTRGTSDVNSQGGYSGNPLQAASVNGYEDMVQQLLDRGANPNAQGGKYGNALHAASKRGYGRAVELLLDHGADVNAQGRKYKSALQAASKNGHGWVVEVLLSRGAVLKEDASDA